MKVNKKGITPVIAVILLLMMTVAAAGAAFYWLVKIQGQMQGGTEQYEERSFERMASTVAIIAVNYNLITKVYSSSTVTPKRVSTGSIGLATVTKKLPANNNPTGLRSSALFLPFPSTTMGDPESPGALNDPGSMMI